MTSELGRAVTRHKSALTRAQKKGPEAVVEACEAAFKEFDVVGWPDQWSHWERAKQDALLTIERERPWI